MGQSDHPGADPLPAEMLDALRDIVARSTSLRGAVRDLGVPRSTVRRALAGQRLRPGSVALLRAALAPHQEEPPT